MDNKTKLEQKIEQIVMRIKISEIAIVKGFW